MSQTEMKQEHPKEQIIVSLTSYPPRIQGVVSVLETIHRQTRPADAIVLYLAESEFPNRPDDLPADLCAQAESGQIRIRWCDDLKPHKKYFYAFQEYPNDVVITMDDDVLYAPDTLELLYKSYQRHPHAVSAMRGHRIMQGSDGQIWPYHLWAQEYNGRVGVPSIHLAATGCAGVLYPPHIFDETLYDKQAIIDTCLYADDLWLKVWEVLSNVPVVLAQKYTSLRFVPGSQAVALYHRNKERAENDIQLNQILNRLDEIGRKAEFFEKLDALSRGSDALLQELMEERADLCEQNHALGQEKEDLTRQLHRSQSAHAKQKQQMQALQAELERYRNGDAHAGEREHSLYLENSDLQEQNRRLQEKNRQLAKENSRYQELNRRFLVKVSKKLRGI